MARPRKVSHRCCSYAMESVGESRYRKSRNRRNIPGRFPGFAITRKSGKDRPEPGEAGDGSKVERERETGR
jgi:hypothetical protein